MPDATGVPEHPGTSAADAPVDPAAALARLDAGNARFVSGALEHPRRDHEHRAALSTGQRPYAVVLGCSDSRVPHEILFDEGLGDLFAVRVAGNTAEDSIVLGSIEFAVAVLGVRAVVVLGHEDCGAVKAALAVARGGEPPAGALAAVVTPIVPVAADVLASMPPDTPEGDLVSACVRANVRSTVDRLAGVELLAAAVGSGTLVLAGREYRLATGHAVTV
jgi:carbonic anhydrase